jgi:prevent-host-death family protein
VGDTIGERELRKDSGAIMRRVEQGKSFTVTRNGRPIADLVPHAHAHDTVRPMDLQIAATAGAHGMPLMTRNPADFAGLDRLVHVITV